MLKELAVQSRMDAPESPKSLRQDINQHVDFLWNDFSKRGKMAYLEEANSPEALKVLQSKTIYSFVESLLPALLNEGYSKELPIILNAAKLGRPAMLELMLQSLRTNLEERDKDHQTVLHLILKKGNKENSFCSAPDFEERKQRKTVLFCT